MQRENVRIRCKEIDNEAEVNRGYILCSNDNFWHVFEAEIQVLELKEKQIIKMVLFVCYIFILLLKNDKIIEYKKI